ETRALHWVTAIPTVRRLILGQCEIDIAFPAPLTTDELYSVVDLRKSNVKWLDLGNFYPYKPGCPPGSVAILALIPSLETLITTPRSFSDLGRLPTTLGLFPLRSFIVASHSTPGSIEQTRLRSFLNRCPTLETLHIDQTIKSNTLELGEPPVDMPSLRSYEGRPEYLTLIRAPALRRAVVKSLEWDGGALILSLAATSTALEGVAFELTARMDSPTTEIVKVCLNVSAIPS
ncbi:hypothetical protein FS837_006325, partial [Tulasnella sp. UAMH 9824]